MKLYLSSYKLGNKTDVLKKWIKDHDNKLLIITNSKDIYKDKDIIFEKLIKEKELIEDLGFKAELLDLKEFFGHKKELEIKLNNYKAVYALGGNVFTLRMAMYLSGFDELIKGKLHEDFLYVCYSAGACVLSPSLKGYELVDEDINIYNNEKIKYDGLNILDYMIIPHYKSKHPEARLIEKTLDYCIKNNIKYKTITDGDVIIIDL